jgi:hypothetical protein
MRSLDVSDTKGKKLDEMENTALDILNDFFKGKRDFGDDVKLAMQSLHVVAKNRQTLTAREGMRFNMVSAITDDPKALKKYVDATSPEIGKLLPGKS